MMTHRQKAKMGTAVLISWVAVVLAVALAYADNMPQPGRGHMGCSNTAVVGMLPVGNGSGFCEQAMPEDCPLSWDGADMICSAGTGTSYDFTVPYSGLPGDAQVIRWKFVEAVTCVDNFVGSYATALTASDASAVFTIKKNGSSIGTATFSTSATGTWNTTGGATSWAVGDSIEIDAPTPQNATLADVGLSFKCTR